jgi:hypothetical protein
LAAKKKEKKNLIQGSLVDSQCLMQPKSLPRLRFSVLRGNQDSPKLLRMRAQMKVPNGKRTVKIVKIQRNSCRNFTQYSSLTPQTMDLRYMDIMVCGGTNKPTSAEADKEAEDSQEPCILRGFLME